MHPQTEITDQSENELFLVDTLLGYFHGRRRQEVARVTLIKLRRLIFDRQSQKPRGETAGGSISTKATELREHLEEVIDLLHTLDKIGDGIGGADGFAVSAVALQAKSLAENALSFSQALEGSR